MARKQYHHGNLKQAILQQSLKQLNLVGAEKLSFRAIAKNLGVVSSAPYNHFASKSELFNRLKNRDMKDKNIVQKRMKQFMVLIQVLVNLVRLKYHLKILLNYKRI